MYLLPLYNLQSTLSDLSRTIHLSINLSRYSPLSLSKIVTSSSEAILTTRNALHADFDVWLMFLNSNPLLFCL